jgi:hypothetical protein
LKPLSFLVGGLLMLAFALGLWMFNKRFTVRREGLARYVMNMGVTEAREPTPTGAPC